VDLLIAAMLLCAGFLGGILATLIGGASLITFPAMLAAGVPPVFAVATNTTALLPAALVAAISDRSQLPHVNRAFVLMMLASFVSAGCGAVLLLLTPARIFELLIPLLLGLGTMLFAYAPRIGAWLRSVQLPRGRGGLSPEVLSIGMIVPVSVYAGYFGAGVGVLLLAAIAIATGGDYRASNVAKNLIGGINSIVAGIIFFAKGAIVWPHILLLAAGGIGGGWVGAQIAKVLPLAAARVMVTGFGLLLTLIYVWRYWL
jgi:uncharacterized membrane protein YfcA